MALRIVTAHCQLLSCALQEWLSSLRSTADTSLRLGLATDTWRTDPSPVLPHCTSHEQSSHCTTVWLSQVQLLLTIVETQPWVSKTRQKQRKSTVPMAFFRTFELWLKLLLTDCELSPVRPVTSATSLLINRKFRCRVREDREVKT